LFRANFLGTFSHPLTILVAQMAKKLHLTYNIFTKLHPTKKTEANWRIIGKNLLPLTPTICIVLKTTKT
jgi:predicted RND superfamily exporter protein